MTNFYFMRHGKVSGPAALYGHTDVDVLASTNDDILAQLSPLKTHFNRVLTSPLIRCSSIASIFSSASELPLTSIDSLKEISFGDVDGLAFADHKAYWPDFEKFWQNPSTFNFDNSESLPHFRARIKTLFSDLCKQYQSESILIVCHGGVIRMLLAIVLDLDLNTPKLFSHLRINNASITHLEHTSANGHVNDFTQIHGINLPISSMYEK
jgi:alpha-ribazole phosphatase